MPRQFHARPTRWFRLGGSPSRRVRTKPTKLRLLPLEDRAVPALFTVNALTDTGAGSGTVGDLRYCINQVNALGGLNTIDATGVTGIITLGQPFFVSDPVTINGPGANLLTVAAAFPNNITASVFSFNPGAGNSVALTGFTMTGGNNRLYGGGITDTSGGGLTLTNMTVTGNSGSGGGLFVSNVNLAVTDCLISNNVGAQGGGIIAYGGSVVIDNSVISGNRAGEGGAVEVYNSTATITNSTLSGNSVQYNGGAINVIGTTSGLTVSGCTLSGNTAAFGGAVSAVAATGPLAGGFKISNSTIVGNTASTGGAISLGTLGTITSSFAGTLNLVSDTITRNTAGPGASGYAGGGIALPNGAATVVLDNTIVSGNSVVSGNGPDISANASAVVQAGYSAIGTTAGYTLTDLGHNLATASSTPAALRLLALANYGGPTATVAIGSNSSAMGVGDPALNGTTDQRGVLRPQMIGPAPQPDIGAFEYVPGGPTVVSVFANDGTVERSEVRSLSVMFSDQVTFADGNAAAAFQLQHVQNKTDLSNLQAIVSANAYGQTIVMLTFTTNGNASTEIDPISALNGGTPSLADGLYQLTIFSSAVTGLDGLNLAGGGPGGNYVSPPDTYGGTGLHLYRLFGDANGDGVVDATDVGQLKTTFNRNTTDPLYLWYLDADNSGAVDAQDVGQLKTRFNHNVF
jgi:hypothetical protein